MWKKRAAFDIAFSSFRFVGENVEKKPIDLKEQLKENPFILAPMAGITDNAFRNFATEMSSSVVVSELVSASGIKYGSQQTLKLMKFEEMQRPVGIQLFGESPEIIAEGARLVQEQGADFVDMNFGCPVNKVVKKGAGSAVLKDLTQLRDILRTVKSAIDIPLTIKIRTGWTFETRNAVDVTQVAYDEGVEWVAIHGRDRKQAYTGRADWEYIAEVKAKSKLPIIGNGDILSGKQANQKLQESGVDGVMIGRGALKNPYIFQESLAIYKGLSFDAQDRDYMKAFDRLRYYLERDCDERILKIQIRKFASWFSAGYPGSAKFRKSLFQTTTVDEAMDLVSEFYDSIKGTLQEDTSGDGFLMGGHG